jgi:hypothetical protein
VAKEKEIGAWHRGHAFESLYHLDHWLDRGFDVFLKDKHYSAGFIIGMQDRTVLITLRARKPFPAIWVKE